MKRAVENKPSGSKSGSKSKSIPIWIPISIAISIPRERWASHPRHGRSVSLLSRRKVGMGCFRPGLLRQGFEGFNGLTTVAGGSSGHGVGHWLWKNRNHSLHPPRTLRPKPDMVFTGGNRGNRDRMVCVENEVRVRCTFRVIEGFRLISSSSVSSCKITFVSRLNLETMNPGGRTMFDGKFSPLALLRGGRSSLRLQWPPCKMISVRQTSSWSVPG